ncbi:hypothetical protein [Nevskia ramosa]|uniref:hypothetical protein n=1 Tax=Nevskia ramosa TaxID=64002 RepID=UPI0003B43280|nr:hypothetical protein [Nevskia ramosa]
MDRTDTPLLAAGCRSWLLVIALLLTASNAAAGDFDALRSQALELDLAASRIGSDTQSETLNVYVGVRAQEVWLREVWLQIDGDPIQHYQYSQREAEALRASGLHGLLSSRLSPGPHRIRAQAAVAEVGAHASEARRRAAVDVNIDKGAAPAELELSWAPGGMVKGSTLKLINWQRSTDSVVPADSQSRYRVGDPIDPRLRAVAFLEATGRHYQSQRLLRQLQAEAPGAAPNETPVPDGPSPGTPAMYTAYQALLAGNADLAAVDRLGAGEPCSTRPTLLCDHVNTELGYAWLAQHEGIKAADVFRRVRAPGPLASAAMLGLGWALLAPSTGAEADKAEATPVAYGRKPLHEPRAMKDKELGGAMRAALVPWIELIGRDPTDPAVQEAQIAIAWAMNELGSEVQAQDYYNRVIAQLEGLVQRCDKARTELAAQTLAIGIVGKAPSEAWHWSLADRLPDPRWWVLPATKDGESFYLIPLLQQASFDAQLRQLREAHEVQAALSAQRQRLSVSGDAQAPGLVASIDALQPGIAATITSTSQALDVLAQTKIAAIRDQALHSLVEARYGLAQLYDRAAEVASK